MNAISTQSKVGKFVSVAAIAVIMGTTGLVGAVNQASAGPNELQMERGLGYASPLSIKATSDHANGSSYMRGRIGFLAD